MKTTRFIALMLVLLMSMTLLTACGGKTEEAAAPAAPTQEAVAPAAGEAGEVPPPPGEPSGELGATTEPPAEFVALDPAGDYSRDWAGYQAYLTEACNAEAAFPDDEMRQMVKDQIAAATEAEYDAAVFPYEMLIGMNIAVSYDEFLTA